VAGRFGWREAILGEQQIDDFLGRFRSQFGRDDDEGLGAAVKIGGVGQQLIVGLDRIVRCICI
jgi:hypothetical protein